MNIKGLEEQDEMSSRRIWQKVSDAIRANDTNLAGVEKSKIENQKREEKAAREAAGTEWEPKYFTWQNEEPNVNTLQRMLQSTVKSKYNPPTSGNWVYKQ